MNASVMVTFALFAFGLLQVGDGIPVKVPTQNIQNQPTAVRTFPGSGPIFAGLITHFLPKITDWFFDDDDDDFDDFLFGDGKYQPVINIYQSPPAAVAPTYQISMPPPAPAPVYQVSMPPPAPPPPIYQVAMPPPMYQFPAYQTGMPPPGYLAPRPPVYAPPYSLPVYGRGQQRKYVVDGFGNKIIV